MAGTIAVRTTHSHGIYKEHHIDGAEHHDIHVTGFDPEDGQVIRDEDGQILTPVQDVPRTADVSAAIAEGRLIDVFDERERARIDGAVEGARARRKAAKTAAPSSATATQVAVAGGASEPSGVGEATGAEGAQKAAEQATADGSKSK